MECNESEGSNQEQNDNIQNSGKKYNKKKLRASHHNKYLKNSSLSKFNLDSHFIYDFDDPLNYLEIIKDKNYIKPKYYYISNIKNIINRINLEKDIENKSLFVKIPEQVYENFQNFLSIKRNPSPLATFLENKFKNEKNRHNLSSRKLTEEYYNTTRIKTNRQTIFNNIIKTQLGYNYRKTTVKNGRVNDYDNIIISTSFIKIITKCIFLGFKIIYVDESTI